MNSEKLSVCLVFLCIIKQISASEDTSSELSRDTLQSQFGIIKSVGMVFRHGNREPVLLYPTDPYNDYAFPFDLGQLTNKGKERAFHLGQYFKPRYTCITGTTYHPSNVLMDSSTTDRCLMSGELFYAGYFPPFDEEIWNPSLAWQPIPVHSTTSDNDNVIEQSESCPRLQQLKENFYATSPLIEKICADYRDMFAYIEKNSGLNLTPCRNITNFENIIYLRDTLFSESEINLELPAWTRSIFPEPLNSLQIKIMEVDAEDPEIFRLESGPLLNVIISDMLNNVHLNNSFPTNIYTSNASQTPALHLFSGHDINLVRLMRGLGVYPNNQLINYSASLNFEMRIRNKTNYMTLVFQNSLDQPPVPLLIPSCNGSCTLQDFVSVVAPLIPENWEAECNVDNDGQTTPSSASQSTTSAPDDPPMSWSITKSLSQEKWTPYSHSLNRSDESEVSDINKSDSDQNTEYANSINSTDV